MSKPKSKPVPMNTKALQAWHSELRRLEKRLEEWDAELTLREGTLEEQEAAFANALNETEKEIVQRYSAKFSPALQKDEFDTLIDEEDCGCTPEDAASNCDCPKCESTRASWVEKPKNFKKFNAELDIMPHHHQELPQPVGDEIKWLESLWKLKDKRQKK